MEAVQQAVQMTTGEAQDTELVTIHENYTTPQHYGRLIARNANMQHQTTQARSAAYRGHAVDVDQDDCYGRLLYNELVEEGLYSDEEFLMVKLSTIHHKKWRA